MGKKKRQIAVLFILMGMLSLKHGNNYSFLFVGGNVSAGEVPKNGFRAVRKILANYGESRHHKMESLGKHSSDLPSYSAAFHIAVPPGWRIWVCEQGASWGADLGGTGSDEAVCPPGNTAAEGEEGSCKEAPTSF